MGTVLTKYQFQTGTKNGLSKPIIYCNSDESIENTAVPLNAIVAKKLMGLKPDRRSFKLPSIVDSVLAELPDGCVIKDFDVLFNPAYQIDVLQLLMASCKKKPFEILWPGIFSENRLLYAESGCPDFKQYNIEQYDVTCIV